MRSYAAAEKNEWKKEGITAKKHDRRQNKKKELVKKTINATHILISYRYLYNIVCYTPNFFRFLSFFVEFHSIFAAVLISIFSLKTKEKKNAWKRNNERIMYIEDWEEKLSAFRMKSLLFPMVFFSSFWHFFFPAADEENKSYDFPFQFKNDCKTRLCYECDMIWYDILLHESCVSRIVVNALWTLVFLTHPSQPRQ